jgi:hypothetical protein
MKVQEARQGSNVFSHEQNKTDFSTPFPRKTFPELLDNYPPSIIPPIPCGRIQMLSCPRVGRGSSWSYHVSRTEFPFPKFHVGFGQFRCNAVLVDAISRRNSRAGLVVYPPWSNPNMRFSQTSSRPLSFSSLVDVCSRDLQKLTGPSYRCVTRRKEWLVAKAKDKKQKTRLTRNNRTRRSEVKR